MTEEKESPMRVEIVLSVPFENLVDFLAAWDGYRENLCELAGIEWAKLDLPALRTLDLPTR